MKITWMDDPAAKLSIVTGYMGSGKSQLVRHFIYRRVMQGLATCVYVFCGADNDDYSFIPECTFYDRYDENVLSEIYNSQQRYKLNGQVYKQPPILIVFDDIFPSISRDRTRKSKKSDSDDFTSLQQLIKTLRHKNVYILGVSQDITGIPPYFREMVTGFSAHFGINEKTAAQKISTVFPPLIGKTGEQCLQYFKTNITEKYYCIVYYYPNAKTYKIKIKLTDIPRILSWNPLRIESKINKQVK